MSTLLESFLGHVPRTRGDEPYNGLVAVWSELPCQAAAIHKTPGDRQGVLDFWRKFYFIATCIPLLNKGKCP